MIVWILMAPFCLQALVLFLDEVYFHRRRGLPLWERLGHPIDTLTVLACFVFILHDSLSSAAIRAYAALAAFSCLCITKDEFIHAEHCSAAEHWLHAVSFMLHPLVLIAAACLWAVIAGGASIWPSLRPIGVSEASLLIRTQTALLVCFLSYQIFYWNIPWKKRAPVGGNK